MGHNHHDDIENKSLENKHHHREQFNDQEKYKEKEKEKEDLQMGRGSLEPQDDEDVVHRSPSDPLVQSRGYYRLAKVFYDKSDLSRANRKFIKALEIAEKHFNLKEKDHSLSFYVFKILGFLVRISSERLESAEAEKYIEQSEQLVKTVKETLGDKISAEYLFMEGTIKTYRGLFSEARTSFLNSMQKAKQENEPEILAKSLFALSTGFYQSKEFEAALKYLDQLDELLKIIKKSYLYGAVHLLYGNIYSERGEFEQALDHYQWAQQELRKKTCWNLFGYILLGEGIIFKNKGEFNKALLFFDLAAKLADQNIFKRLHRLLQHEVMDVNDSSVDLYLDRTNRMVYEKTLGPIDFKHRFVLLEILFLLAKKPGTYFDKEGLARLIWKDEYNPLIHDKLIYTSVSRLRKLIEPKNGKRKYIIRGKDGYTFGNQVKVRFHKEAGEGAAPAIANIDLSSPV